MDASASWMAMEPLVTRARNARESRARQDLPAGRENKAGRVPRVRRDRLVPRVTRARLGTREKTDQRDPRAPTENPATLVTTENQARTDGRAI